MLSAPNYEFIKTEIVGEKKNVAVITLNRPKALNALCIGLMAEVVDALQNFDKDKTVGAVVLTGIFQNCNLISMYLCTFISNLGKGFTSIFCFLQHNLSDKAMLNFCDNRKNFLYNLAFLCLNLSLSVQYVNHILVTFIMFLFDFSR